jgi:NTE family protein
MDSKRVALALGGGGARGYAHIGVIDELHSRGYEIVGIAGCSMGALVGGLQAAGALDEFADWARTLSQRAVLRLLDPAWTGAGIFRAEKILDVVRDLLGDTAIESLPVPYTAVATDLIAGKTVWLQRGPLDAAIRASIAIPGMISPYILGGRVLVDGGILDPLPVTPLAGVQADVSIAVSLSGEDAPDRASDTPEPRAASEWLNRLLRSTSAWLETNAAARSVIGRFGGADGEGAVEAEVADDLADDDVATASGMVPRLGAFEVMNRSIDVMQAALARHHLSAYPPDVLIELPRTTSRSLDFHRAADVIDIGRSMAARALDDYEGAGTQTSEEYGED